MATSLRILFFGTDSIYSRLVLERLLTSTHHLCAVLLPGSQKTPGSVAAIRTLPAAAAAYRAAAPDELALANPFVNHSTLHVAWAQGIPVFAIDRLEGAEAQTLLRSLNPDVACVACFPRRIPADWLTLPKEGFLNVHPSLLPGYRGPAPLFWQFRAGEGHMGVTIHWMDAEFDTGPVAAQRECALPDGVGGPQADAILATAGGELLVAVLDGMANGNAIRQPQPPGGSYHSWPGPEDFAISPLWSAQRVYNFMRGTAEWGHPYLLELGKTQLLLSEAVRLWPSGNLVSPFVCEGDTVRFQCTPGILEAKLAGDGAGVGGLQLR